MYDLPGECYLVPYNEEKEQQQNKWFRWVFIREKGQSGKTTVSITNVYYNDQPIRWSNTGKVIYYLKWKYYEQKAKGRVVEESHLWQFEAVEKQ